MNVQVHASIAAGRVRAPAPAAASASRRHAAPTAAAAAGPPTIDVVRVVEQPLDATLSMPAS